MKSAEELQRAHDILWAIMTGEVPSPLGSRVVGTPIHAALDVLSPAGRGYPALGHDHSTGFQDSLGFIESWLRARGFVLEQVADEPLPPDEFRRRTRPETTTGGQG